MFKAGDFRWCQVTKKLPSVPQNFEKHFACIQNEYVILFLEETFGELPKTILGGIFEVISRRIPDTLTKYQEEFQEHSLEKSLGEFMLEN